MQVCDARGCNTDPPTACSPSVFKPDRNSFLSITPSWSASHLRNKSVTAARCCEIHSRKISHIFSPSPTSRLAMSRGMNEPGLRGRCGRGGGLMNSPVRLPSQQTGLRQAERHRGSGYAACDQFGRRPIPVRSQLTHTLDLLCTCLRIESRVRSVGVPRGEAARAPYGGATLSLNRREEEGRAEAGREGRIVCSADAAWGWAGRRQGKLKRGTWWRRDGMGGDWGDWGHA